VNSGLSDIHNSNNNNNGNSNSNKIKNTLEHKKRDISIISDTSGNDDYDPYQLAEEGRNKIRLNDIEHCNYTNEQLPIKNFNLNNLYGN